MDIFVIYWYLCDFEKVFDFIFLDSKIEMIVFILLDDGIGWKRWCKILLIMIRVIILMIDNLLKYY